MPGRSGLRSSYERVKALDLDINQKILVTFDENKIPDSRNPGLQPFNPDAKLFIAGHRRGVLVGEISIIRFENGRVWITTEHGTIQGADEFCPAWRVPA